jgi:hypothetical protein
MYGIYANIGGILMGSMLPYIAAPWILWDMDTSGIMAQPHPFDHLGPWPLAASSQRDKICWDVATSRDASAN